MRENMPQIQIHDGCIEQQTVEQVEDAADAGEQPARILHAGFSFEKGFDQITDYSGNAQQDAECCGVNETHPGHLAAEEMGECQTRSGREYDRARKSLPCLARADSRNHFMPANERADHISAGIADLCHENEVKHIEFPVGLDARKEIDLLNEVQQPRHIHQSEQGCGYGKDSSRVTAGGKLPKTQPEHEEDQKARFEVVHPRRRTGCADVSGEVQECAEH